MTLRRDLLGESNLLRLARCLNLYSVTAPAFFNPPSNIMFDSLVLVETPIHHPSAEVHHTAMYKAFATVDNRHDIWTSREAAKAWLGKRFPWKVWDLEVLDIYVVSIGLPVFLSLLIVAQNHGLRPLPTAFYPDKTDGVTLSATWVDENAAYSKDGGTSFTALRNLNTLYSVVPVHLVAPPGRTESKTRSSMPTKEGPLLL